MNPLSARLHAGSVSEIFVDLRFRLWESMEEPKIDSVQEITSISSRTKLNSLVERGNRELLTGNRKISCVINCVPLLKTNRFHCLFYEICGNF